MGKKITYLLGAGASCNALPLLGEMRSSMRKQKILLEEDLDNEYADRLAKDIEWILEESDIYFTVDTLAKKYYVQNQFAKLKRLKRYLSAFFLLEQLRKRTKEEPKRTNVDLRYINFLASTTIEDNFLRETIRISPDIRILNWNYDIQFELAFRQFLIDSKHAHLDEVTKENLPCYPFSEIYKAPDEEPLKSTQMIHLNGIAGSFGLEKRKRILQFVELDSVFSKGSIEIILDTAIRELYEKECNFDESFVYAWEYATNSIAAVNLAKTFLEDTDILVIIGYSFPFFNREIDRDLVSSFLAVDKSKLKERSIYYQDPVLDSQVLRGKFNISDDVRIETIRNVDQFHLPFEM